MAKVLETVINFESGTFHECIWTEGVPTIETDPAPPYEHETYITKLPSFGAENSQENYIYVAPIAAEQNKYAIGFYVQFGIVDDIVTLMFFGWKFGAGYDFRLGVVSGGALRIYDSVPNIVATSAAGVFVVNTWHLVELLFTHGDPGDLIIHVDENEVLNTSGEDYDGGS